MGTSSAARERESVLTVAPGNRRRTSIDQMRRDPPKGQVCGDVGGPPRSAPPASSRRPRLARRAAFVSRRGRIAAAALFVAGGAFLLVSAGCSSSQTASAPIAAATTTTGRALPATAAPKPAPPVRPVAHLLVRAPAHVTSGWAWVARVHGKPAAWVAQRGGVTLMRFDQGLMHLNLHAGSSDGGVGGWTYGDQITPREIHLVVAAVNGGFKLTYHDVGFMSGGHVAAELRSGLASIVTYTDGTSDIGAWRAGVPSAGKRVFSVLQNQRLLIDGGVAPASVSNCIITCWGETIGSRTVVARAALGIRPDGQLVWAAGAELQPADLTAALKGAGVVRALELDINPAWVAGYLYVHHNGGPSAVPVVPGQVGIAGRLLEPYSRDFLAFVAN
jgi:hypothetical protein